MATFSERVIVTERHEYRVPAKWPPGAHSDELGKAFAAANQAAKTFTPRPDLFVLPGDEELIIYFDVQRQPGGTA